MNLLQTVQAAIEAALTGLAPDPAASAAQVKPTQDAKHGDYQANCALSLQKVIGGTPREIAQKIVDRLDLGDWLQKPEIAGPGFINLRLRDDWLASQMQRMATDPRLLVGIATKAKTYVIDYSGPNVAKPMHVGHLRSTIIGDCLIRLLRHLGHRVVGDNHLGDWGTQFGIILYGYKNHLDRAAYEADPVQELARLYVKVRKMIRKDDDEEAEGDDPIAAACRAETAKLHAGDPENLALWREFMPYTYEELRRVYSRLTILPFDHQHGESFYHDMLAEVVKELREKGIAQESQGAIAIFLRPEKKDEPPALIQKRDGAYTYTTTDLATIAYRVKEFQPDHILYVVDFRQGQHFANLFEIARRWGFGNVDFQHVSFGSVLDPKSKKPIKTREGGGVSLEDLLEQGVKQALETYRASAAQRRAAGQEAPELTPEEELVLANSIGRAAIKYADLCQSRTSDYSFSWDKMLAMTGNTATYMQYAYARIRSIFRKGEESVEPYRTNPPPVTLDHPAERNLALQLLRFEDALHMAAQEFKPNFITGYLWDLSNAYSTFFEACPVLKAETTELRKSRILLCDLTARVIQQGLDLLGIQTVERM